MSNVVAGLLTDARHRCGELGLGHRRHVSLDEIERHQIPPRRQLSDGHATRRVTRDASVEPLNLG